MSRKKNQTVAPLKPGQPWIQQFMIAASGWRRQENPQAWALAEDAAAVFDAMVSAEYYAQGNQARKKALLKQIEQERQQLGARLLSSLRDALAAGSGRFFHAIGEAIENRSNAADPMRVWLLNFFASKVGTGIYSAPAPRKVALTFSQVCDAWDRAGIDNPDQPSNARHMRDVIAGLGIQLLKEKRGRKPHRK